VSNTSKLQLLQEITEWDVDTPNHQYLLAPNGKMIAYKKQSSDVWQLMSKARMFTKSYRKFKRLPFPETLNGIY